MKLRRLRVDWPTFWGAALFILIGGGFAGFGAYQTVTTWQFMQNATEVSARVVDNPGNCDDGCTWWPDLKLTAPDGTRVATSTRFGSSNYGWSEGSNIAVYYNPKYDYVRPTSAEDRWLLGGSFFFIGLLPFIIGIWLMLRQVFYRVERS